MERFCKNENSLKVYGWYKTYLPTCEKCKNKDQCKTNIDDECFMFPSPVDLGVSIGINMNYIIDISEASSTFCTVFGNVVLLILQKSRHYIDIDDLNRLFNLLEQQNRYDILLKLREGY